MPAVGGVGHGLSVAALIASVIIACATTPQTPGWQLRQAKLNEITALWTQIRDWRREANMDLDPSPASLIQWRGRALRDAKRVCAEGHVIPKSCQDICILAEHICDNAETICKIADELGEDDHFAQEKCTSAKASCREAKQRCCDCEEPAP